MDRADHRDLYGWPRSHLSQKARGGQARDVASSGTAYVGAVVYVWMAPDGKADYVGRGSMRRAISRWTRPYATDDHILLTMTCASEWEAMEYEGKWGARYQPRHNIEGYRYD